LNPDEADLLVAGLRASENLIPLKTFTTSTYGPLGPQLLGILHILGLPLNLLVAHLLATVLAVFIATVYFSTTKRLFGHYVAVLTSLPLVWIWADGGTNHEDFLHLSPSLIPVSILVFAGWVYLVRQSIVGSAAICLLASLATLAKYQFGVISAVFLAYVLKDVVASHPNFRFSRRLIAGFLMGSIFLFPIAIQALMIFLSGERQAMFDESLAVVINYLRTTREYGFVDRITQIIQLILLREPWILIPPAAGVLYIGCQFVYQSSRSDIFQLYVFAALRIFVTMASGVLSIAIGPNVFPHHLYVLLASGIVSVPLALRSLPPASNTTEGRLKNEIAEARMSFVRVLAVVVLTISLVMIPQNQDGKLSTYQGAPGLRFTSNRARLPSTIAGVEALGTKCPPKSVVYVFGWSAEMYSYFDWTPASRYTISTWLTGVSSKQLIYRNTLAHEVRVAQPDCIVEAVGEGFFASSISELTKSLLTVMPELYDYMVSHYEAHRVVYSGQYGDQVLTYWVKHP